MKKNLLLSIKHPEILIARMRVLLSLKLSSAHFLFPERFCPFHSILSIIFAISLGFLAAFTTSKEHLESPTLITKEFSSLQKEQRCKKDTLRPSPLPNRNFPTMTDSNPQTSSEQLDRVCIIGSGNWGSAIATLVGPNCERLPYYEDKVNMWVYEEIVEVEGAKQKLTEVINTRRENVKYLPGIRIPDNVRAVPDLEEACRDATLLVFVLPHQFLPKLLPTIRESAHATCRGISLIKGLGKCISCVQIPQCLQCPVSRRRDPFETVTSGLQYQVYVERT